MNSNHNILFGRMFPDFYHPALARDAAAIAKNARPSRARTMKPVPFAEVQTFVDAFYKTIAAQTSSRSFPRLGKSGLTARGAFWMLNTSEFPNDGGDYSACSLAAILETWEDWHRRHPKQTRKSWDKYIQRFYLSARGCRGILRRAENRGKELPRQLKQALQAVAMAEAIQPQTSSSSRARSPRRGAVETAPPETRTKRTSASR